jgi:hypothetical protein
LVIQKIDPNNRNEKKDILTVGPDKLALFAHRKPYLVQKSDIILYYLNEVSPANGVFGNSMPF